MSGIEDPQDASTQDDVQREILETATVSEEVTNSIGESDSSQSPEKPSAKDTEETREEIKEKEQTEEEQKERLSEEETQQEGTTDSELAAVTRSASSTTPDDAASTPVSGIIANEARQIERVEPRTGLPPPVTVDTRDGRRISGHSATVGEWNSLPVLVERLREALELSLAAGVPSLAEAGAEVERGRTRRSMEQAVLGGGCVEPEPRKDELRFLEDLLLSDIQTALSRLRQTLEHTDVATLAKHGGVSDPTSKLHLLRLVSSLLSRLQVPEEARGDNRTIDVAQIATTFGKRRRAVRHTIGVSAEEIAHARRQLEESSADLERLNDATVQRREPLPSVANNSVPNGDRHLDEIHDKYTKDVINQRQSLRDRNKDSRGDTCAYRPAPLQIGYADRPITTGIGEPGVHPICRRCSVDSYQERGSCDEEEVAIKRACEEQSRVTKLAAALRQRAELLDAKCNNKYTVKKSKIKRANTVDIPSYLKLQAKSLGCDNSGCALLRRPINVGDKVPSNAPSVVVPSFQARTENDKKFLALINKNNETQAFNAAPAFKSFGYTKTTDMPSVSNENWNSRFSNIKTAFDKPSANDHGESKLSPKPRAVNRFPVTSQASPQINKKAPIGSTRESCFPLVNASKPDAGFKHAPSSLFRKIEKPHGPKSPSSNHWQRDNVPPPGNTLRDKARIMFDRDGNVKSQALSKFKIDDGPQKSSFPRPPWLEHSRNDGKSGNMVTENGRLDYRLFCKQFAPFIGKGTAAESRKSQIIEDPRKRNDHSTRHKNIASSKQALGATDGKISLKMFAEKDSPVQQCRPNERREIDRPPIRDKFDLQSEKDTFEPTVTCNDHRCKNKNFSDATFTRNIPMDATFRGNSSVAVQTGMTDDHSEEARVFRVVPAIKGPPSMSSNASVQTYNETEQSTLSVNHLEPKEPKEQWKTARYERDDVNRTLNSGNRHAKDPTRSVLDENYHAASTTVADESASSLNEDACNLANEHHDRVPNAIPKLPFKAISGYQSPEQHDQIYQPNAQYESYLPFKATIDRLPYVKSNGLAIENQAANVPYDIDDRDSMRAIDDLPEERNIQNQDINADAGVITRYTCAIATVASADIPRTQSNETDAETAVSTFPSLSQSWLHTKPATNEITASQEEIRRHNMLQQNLVRRLRNERTMSNQQNQPISNHSVKPQPGEPPKRTVPARKSEPPPVVVGLLSVPAAPAGISAMNRVTALREQYEQPNGQCKPVQKERSPVPNGVSAMDSSDEYLVSCSSKPCRSIVLSKSESWHQLALSNSHHLSPRTSQDSLPVPPSVSVATPYLPKPPKPKSPSSFRMKKQYEASSSADSVRKMENKIRRYFDSPCDNADAKDPRGRRFSSRDSAKGMIALARSRTMPGMCDERPRLLIPAPQIPAMNLNSADVDKVFDDIFEEATRADDRHF